MRRRRRRVASPEDRLDLPELRGLEPGRRFETIPEGRELERGHRLEDVDLGDEGLEDLQHPVQQVKRRVRVARLEGPLDLGQLVDELLEPQLVDLVDDDEQELVMLGPAVHVARQRLLRGEQLLEGEVGRIGDGPTGHAVRRSSRPAAGCVAGGRVEGLDHLLRRRLHVVDPASVVDACASTTSSRPPLTSQPQAQRLVYRGSSVIGSSLSPGSGMARGRRPRAAGPRRPAARRGRPGRPGRAMPGAADRARRRRSSRCRAARLSRSIGRARLARSGGCTIPSTSSCPITTTKLRIDGLAIAPPRASSSPS